MQNIQRNITLNVSRTAIVLLQDMVVDNTVRNAGDCIEVSKTLAMQLTYVANGSRARYATQEEIESGDMIQTVPNLTELGGVA